MMRKKNSRLTKEEKEFIKKMTLDGKSLRQISKIMDLEITTIYYQVRKFKPKQKKDFIINLPDKKIGELMGAFAGDGSYYYSNHGRSGHHIIRYSLCLSRDMNYAKYLIDLLRKLNLNPFLSKKERDNGMDLGVSSISYINFIKKFLEWDEVRSHSIRLKENINRYSEDFLRGFARGLMDTDGYVEISNVSCGSTSERLIKNLSQIFDKFGLGYKISVKKREPLRKNLFLIRVYRDSLKNYNKSIGFSNDYKLKKLKKILENKWGC
jgi:hypothetical protein